MSSEVTAAIIDFDAATLKKIKNMEMEVQNRSAFYGQYDPIYEMRYIYYVKQLRQVLRIVSPQLPAEVIEQCNNILKGDSNV